MRSAYYQLLGHIVLAVESCEQNASLEAALQKAGFGADALAEGKKLADRGQALIKRKAEEAFEDRYYEHNLHYSAAEVDMWQRTVKFLLKQHVEDEALLALALGESIHAVDHTTAVAARGIRTLGMLRTEPRLYEPLTNHDERHDLINRGRAMLGKIYRNGEVTINPGSAGHAADQVFADIAQQRKDMVQWLQKLGVASAKMTATPALLGELGYVPDGVGLAMGGNAFHVPLHERAQRAELPSTENLRPDPGWSIGRQGQNRENWGPGFIEPRFK